MRRFFAAILLALLAAPVFAVPPRTEIGPPTPRQLAAGQELAQRVRSSMPEENSEIHGKLIIQSGDETREIPIVCRVCVNQTNWTTDYETAPTARTGAEHLLIVHSTNGPNEYFYARAASPSAPLPKMKRISADEADIPLAGSDFSLADLGLEFLHWPAQRELPDETRLSQPCFVLESGNPNGHEIVRVRSDIDKNNYGLLIAEADDARSHVIKKFSLHGSSFKKVNGRWQLEKMDIRNEKTGSHTELKFDLNK